MMLGLFLVWGAVDISQGGENRALTPAATLWFLMVPTFDTFRVMIRRVVRGRSPFAADACHLHHLFVRSGWNVSETIAVICTLAALGAAVGLIGHGFDVSQFGMAVAYVLAGTAYYFAVESAWRRKTLSGTGHSRQSRRRLITTGGSANAGASRPPGPRAPAQKSILASKYPSLLPQS